ncbi:hypothetical protein BLOT_007353 [Blomia tropicalis]|nr:hypothetical protein BLOT_007353 [Blomia tropicalis]
MMRDVSQSTKANKYKNKQINFDYNCALGWPPTGQDGKLDGNANACLMPYGCESFIHPFCRSCAWPEFGLACIQFTIALYDKVGKWNNKKFHYVGVRFLINGKREQRNKRSL